MRKKRDMQSDSAKKVESYICNRSIDHTSLLHNVRIEVSIKVSGSNRMIPVIGGLLLDKLSNLIGRLKFAKNRVYIRPEGD